MKILIKYNDNLYLHDSKNKEVNYFELFHQINEGRWADECHSIEWIKENAEVICFLNNEAELVEND